MDRETVLQIAEILHQRYGSKMIGEGEPGWGLIRTIISQNTNESNTEKGFKNILNRFSSIEEVSEAEEKDIAEALKPSGLYNQKAKRIKNISKWIVERNGLKDLLNEPERGRKVFLEKPGIGPKTVDVVLAFYAGLPILPVDTHVNRVSKRLGVTANDASYNEIRRAWEEKLEGKFLPDLHLDLIRHGRQICKSRKPLCKDCPISFFCKWFKD